MSSVLDEGRSGSLAAGCLSILRRALNVAVANKVIDENPLPEIGRAIAELPSLTQAEVPSRDAWSHEEAAAILELAESYHRNLYVALEIALGCGGPRRGELLALEWSDIDFQRNRIHFRRTLRHSGRRSRRSDGKETKLPKNRRGRWAPGPARLFEVLRQELERQRRLQLKGYPEPRYPVCSPRGLRWQERNFTRKWESLRRRFGSRARPLPFHCCRHSYISWNLAAGRSPKHVSEWCGVSPETIYKHYLHAIVDDAEPLDVLAPKMRRPATPRTAHVASPPQLH
ncbi:MAG: site-specific integrase [Myxococcales bacterium]|nr:site-specific integrase [Myxococcales bacterium]